jgi:hypothetical protein
MSLSLWIKQLGYEAYEEHLVLRLRMLEAITPQPHRRHVCMV